MTVKITRRSYYYGSFGKLKLRLNSETILKLKNGETKIVELDRSESLLEVKEMGSRSNKLIVNDGDCVDIDVNPWAMWYRVFMGIFIGVAVTFSPVSIWITAFLVALIAAIPFFLFPVYELSKLNWDKSV